MLDRSTDYEKLIDLVSDSTLLTFRLYYFWSRSKNNIHHFSERSFNQSLHTPPPLPSLLCPHETDERIDGWVQIHSVARASKITYHMQVLQACQKLS